MEQHTAAQENAGSDARLAPDAAAPAPAGIDPMIADSVPVDAPLAPAGAFERMLDLLDAGGPVVAILIAMSVVATAVVIAKLWQFARTQVGNRRIGRDALALYKASHPKEALFLVRHAASPVAQTLARAMRGQMRGLPEAKVREEVLRYGADALEALRGGFRVLEVIASLAPLLGLFGTVLGMIEAFRQLEAAGAQVNPAILSGGIWQALLTTAVGLAVAIPVVAVLNWLERRVDGLAHEMDTVTTQLFTEDLSDDAPDQEDQSDEPGRLQTAPAAE